MERRRSSDETFMYPKFTKYLRIVEMLLCALCLALAFYLWSAGSTFLGAIVILFSTSFGFLAVTLIDVMASLRNRQYPAPIWAGLAFLAAFMFFLSFGFMVLQSVIPYILIGVVFAVTGIVFLIDGIIIIMHFFQLKHPKKVHPIPEKKGKESRDQATQVEEEFEMIEEVPIEVKKVAPKFAALKETNRNPSLTVTSPRSSFPITSYGGTFPVGGSDAAPLPTPDYLTGVEPVIPAQLYVPPRRGTQENSPETRSVSTETTTPRLLSIEETPNIYPNIIEETVPEESVRSGYDSSVPSEPEVLQPIRPGSYSSGPTYNLQTDEETPLEQTRRSKVISPPTQNRRSEVMPPPTQDRRSESIPPPAQYRRSEGIAPPTQYRRSEGKPPATYNQQNEVMPPAKYNQQNVAAPMFNRQNQNFQPQVPEDVMAQTRAVAPQTYSPYYQENNQGPMMPSYQAAGEPQPIMNRSPRGSLEPRHQRQTCPGNAQFCQCCAARATQEARDQVAPFVTHHFSQVPCVCGYTHYQATTVVKGAVKQNPQDTVQQQQKMIKEQLEVTRDSNAYHGCSCHDKSFKETNDPQKQPADDPPVPKERKQSNSINSMENNYDAIRTRNGEQGSNSSMDLTGSILEVLANNLPGQTVPQAYRRHSDDSKRKVTIGTLEFIPSPHSSQDDEIAKQRRSIDKGPNISNKPPDKFDSVYAEDGQPENWQPYRADNVESSRNPDARDESHSVTDKDINFSRFRELNQPDDLSKITILSRDLDRSSSSLDDVKKSESCSPYSNETSASGHPEHNSQYVRRRSSTLGNKEIHDSNENVLKRRSFPPSETIGTNNERLERSHAPGAERPSLDRGRRTWTSDAQVAPRSSFGPPSSERDYECRSLPPKCLCCPNARNKSRTSPRNTTGRNEERRTSIDSDRRSNERQNPSDVARNHPFVRREGSGFRRASSDNRKEERRYPERLNPDNELFHRSNDFLDSCVEDDDGTKISNPLPRSLDPIEEHRSREGINTSDSEGRTSHSSTNDGSPENESPKEKMACQCACICRPQSISQDEPKEPNKSIASKTRSYDHGPLDQKPYHPKDNFKMVENPFTVNSHRSDDDEECMCKVSQRHSTQKPSTSRPTHGDDYQPVRTTLEPTGLKTSPERGSYVRCLEECKECSTKRQKKLEGECLEECSSCPIRIARLEREAKLLEELEEDRMLSSSTRSSLKRSHPDAGK